MEQDRNDAETIRPGISDSLLDKPLQVNADNTENIPASAPQERQDTYEDSDSSPPKPVKRSTTLSEHKEGAINKDRDASKAKAEAKYLDKCDRLAQTAMSGKLSEALCKERQDKLDGEYQKKLAKIDKRYYQKLEKAERKVEKVKSKQEASSPSSQSSTHAYSAPSTPVEKPNKNKVKSFFNSMPSSSTAGGSYSSRPHTSSFNPGIGGAVLTSMTSSAGHGGAIGSSGGCDGGGAGIGGAGGCHGGGSVCSAGVSGC